MADERDAEFAFDLFSDIAPLLALFGDQFARQFASESLTWVDHLIFAMVPLGILTVITGAIRVQGPRIAKSFIGRARENRALAELELMSSTSGEVCELFNGKSIIRAMGKPKIAQILIFPDKYCELRGTYYDLDSKGQTSNSVDEPKLDPSCGIHSLQSAAPIGIADSSRLMECVDYHSYSHKIIGIFLKRTRRRLVKLFPNFRWLRRSAFDGQPRRVKDYTWMGPPNLQLGLSSDHYDGGSMEKWHEVLLAAVAAVILQASLLAIATMTVFHQRTRRAISTEPKEYGYPCYMIGSVLLSIGIGLSSLAVERNTIEHDWIVLKPNEASMGSKEANVASEDDRATYYKPEQKNCPRLLWLQRTQEVNEQTFDGYAILAGPKCHIVTSSRIEDTIPREASLFQHSRPSSQVAAGAPKSPDDATEHIEQASSRYFSNRTWEYITVFAVVAAGVGFIAQFMGLRGLTYPCSIAQLIAIFLMAFIRALIRRRLGRVPAHQTAFSRYEIDFLATRIVHYPDFRDFHEGLQDKVEPMGRQTPQDVFLWEVKTASGKLRHPAIAQFSPFTTSHSVRSEKLSPPKNFSEAKYEVASSGQLLRVRERLGDLCGWPSLSLESARSLVLSVEAFMEAFFPFGANEQLSRKPGKRLESLTWVIETTALSPGPDPEKRSECVTISVRRLSNTRKWQADIGRIEAILSLWMANLVAKATGKISENSSATPPGQQSINWRRGRAGNDLQCDFCRILGDNLADGALRRDLAWWADEMVTEGITKAEVPDGSLEDKSQLAETNDVPAFLTKSLGENSKSTSPWRYSNVRTSRTNATDLIIGFNGRPDPKASTDSNSDEDARGDIEELAVASSGYLPTILAQHLFTSFMWAVVEQLPNEALRQSEQDIEIDSRHAFDPHDFNKTWLRPTLRHRKLSTLIRKLEEHKLGTYKELLLCMVPALSFKDLLPNHVILKLIPQMRQGQGWVATARSYNRLLETSIRTDPEESFCYNVVVATMDFLYFACEPYDKWVKPSLDDLTTEFEDLVARLASPKFLGVLIKLNPIYEIQRRRERFEAIFSQFGSDEGTLRLEAVKSLGIQFRRKEHRGWSNPLKESKFTVDFAFCETKLGFSKRYRDIYLAALKEETSDAALQNKTQRSPVAEAKIGDIFGWTPLHYAAFIKTDRIVEDNFDASDIKSHLSIHQILDRLNRSPIHVAASAGDVQRLDWLLECLSVEDQKHALMAVGLDGMTPLHLATKSGQLQSVKRILKATQKVAYSDFWGREAMHLAASFGYDEISTFLLEGGSKLGSIDETGRSPLAYLLKGDADMRNEDTGTRMHSSPSSISEASTHLTINNEPDAVSDELRVPGGVEPEQMIQAIQGLAEISDRIYVRDETETEEGTARDGVMRPMAESAHSVQDANSTPAETPNSGHRSSLEIRDTSQPYPVISEPGESPQDRKERTKRKQKMFRDFAKSRPEYQDKEGKTFFHLAIEHADYETVGELLSLGYDINQCDSLGRTPLHLAINAERTELALTLLRGLNFHIADPSISDEQGETVLMVAAEKGILELVEVLVRTHLSKLQSESQEDESGTLVETESHKGGAVSHLGVCDPLATNSRGRTALHIAISNAQHKVTRFLLDQDKLQRKPRDTDGDSLLLTACLNGCPRDCIQTILRNWPEILNEADEDYDQTPLSWACEKGHDKIVETLLEYSPLDPNRDPALDVNKASEGWRLYTPLHFAAAEDHAESSNIIQLLLNHENIVADPLDNQNNIPLDIAIRRRCAGNVRAFLSHPKYPVEVRLQYLREFCQHSMSDMHDIMPDILRAVPDDKLDNDTLSELVELSEDLRNTAPHKALVQRAFDHEDTWKYLKDPLHKAVRLGSLQAVRLAVKFKDPTILDADQWSCLDYASLYCSEGVSEEVKQCVMDSLPPNYRKPGHIWPNLLCDDHMHGIVGIDACKDPAHRQCPGMHDVKVLRSADLDQDARKMLLRTINCVPPPSGENTSFYFEVKLLEDTESKLFALGFCEKRFPKEFRPGLEHISFGYHGDDGSIFLGTGYRVEPSDDFGVLGQYSKGDTVGIGLHLETGKGFITLNGKKRDVGQAFEDENFSGKKMYPCVGFDTSEDGVGLHFEWNLSGGPSHPFMYTEKLP